MTEISAPWDGTVTGHASQAPYSADEWGDWWSLMNQYDRTIQGVLATVRTSYTGMLNVTNPSGTTARVASGAAMVDGTMYRNSANIDFSCGSSGNYYTIVLRKSWSAQTIVAALLGPQAGSPPSVTQTDGTTWEIAIATVQNTAGVLTITDKRHYVNRPRVATAYAAPIRVYNNTALGVIDPGSQFGWDMPINNDCDAYTWISVPGDFTGGSITARAWILNRTSGAGNLCYSWQFYGYRGTTLPWTGGTVTEATKAFAADEHGYVESATISSTDIRPGDHAYMMYKRNGDLGPDTLDTTSIIGFELRYSGV